VGPPLEVTSGAYRRLIDPLGWSSLCVCPPKSYLRRLYDTDGPARWACHLCQLYRGPEAPVVPPKLAAELTQVVRGSDADVLAWLASPTVERDGGARVTLVLQSR
jgi:hypothetical protein